MSTMFELVGEYRNLYELELDDETMQDTLEAIDWTDRLSEKVEGYAQVIESTQADVKMYEEAEKKFKAKKEAAKKKVEWLQGNVFDAMKLTNLEEIKSGIFTVSIKKNPESVKVDETLLPKQYFVQTVTEKPDKKALKELLKAGEVVEGAELVRTEKLVIK